jgi:hypothetical protein
MKKTHNVESAEVVEGQEDQQKVEDCIDVDPAGNLWIVFLTVLNLKEKNCKTHFLHFIQNCITFSRHIKYFRSYDE